MEINWQVEDGFVRNGTQSFDVDDEDILDCGNVDDAMRMIEDEVMLDFNNKVSWCFQDGSSIRAQVEKVFAEKAKEDE